MIEKSLHNRIIEKSVKIHAEVASVWQALTDPLKIKIWMNPGSEIKIVSGFSIGSDFVISGNLHHVDFVSRGKILSYVPEKRLGYTQLSSLSQLAEEPQNYSHLEFELLQGGEAVNVLLKISGFPTVTIYHHLAFYWNSALEVLKKKMESGELE